MKLSEFIIAYRKAQGFSQRQFAKVCDLSNGYISMLENELNPKTKEPVQPSIPVLKKIAIGMGISLSELLSSVDDTLIYIGDYDPNLEKSEELIKLYYNNVLAWSTNMFISKANQKNIKGHFAELLLRYKLFLEALSTGNKTRIEQEIQSMEAWISAARSFALSDEDREFPSFCSYSIPYSNDTTDTT